MNLRSELVEISRLISMMEQERLHQLLESLTKHPANVATINLNEQSPQSKAMLRELTQMSYISNIAEIRNSLKLRMN